MKIFHLKVFLKGKREVDVIIFSVLEKSKQRHGLMKRLK